MVKKFGNLPTTGETHLYTIYSGPYRATFTDLGATWVSFLMPDRAGKLTDVILGYGTAREYNRGDAFLGAVVGRNANRIAGATFSLGDRKVELSPNEGENNLHSGPDYWHRRLWTVEHHGENTITFGLDSPDGDQGFPGAGRVLVQYTLSGGSLTVSYQGCFDCDTLFNPTQHAYFNLAGHDHPEQAPAQYLTIAASHYTSMGEGNIPTGEILPVAGTVLDYTKPRRVGRNLEKEPLLRPQHGLDHNFVLDRPGLDVPAAKLVSPYTGCSLQVYTDCPGIQVYGGNFLRVSGKKQFYYDKNSGVCLETQFFPNSPNVPHWPQCVVKAGQTVVRTTRFVFGLEK